MLEKKQDQPGEFIDPACAAEALFHGQCFVINQEQMSLQGIIGDIEDFAYLGARMALLEQ